MNYLNDFQVLELATKAHQGQKREGGEPYITHPIAVAEIATKIAVDNGISGNLLSVVYQTAILHDVLEDTHETSRSLLEQGVKPIVVDSLFFLNKKNYKGYTDMIMALRTNFISAIVKYADLTHNSSDLKKSSRLDKYQLAREVIKLMTPSFTFEV